MKSLAVAVLIGLGSAACLRGPVIDTNPPPPNVGGTISGIVSSSGGTALSARKVTATNTGSGAKFEESTAANGGYTIKVPAGTYRLDVELRAGESVATQPDTTDVNVGDLDGQRNFVLTVR